MRTNRAIGGYCRPVNQPDNASTPAAFVPAVVREWHSDLGWGVLDSPATPGGCWAHFSCLRMSGFHTLEGGQQVWATFEPANQDGYQWRAIEVQLSEDPAEHIHPDPAATNSTAYHSTLTLTFDDGTAITRRDDESMDEFLRRSRR